MAILDLNNTQDIYNRTPKRDFTQAYNEMLQANQVLNNPNLGGASFTPKKSLVDIHNEAMAKNTPAWAMALSNAMPSIGEIVANATIKNGFQQRPVAESLERQKQRQQAYNQWLQENEQNQAKDFVQIAKEQLGMDIADDDRKWNRDLTARQLAYKQAIDKQIQANNERDYNEKVRQFNENLKFQREQAKANAENKIKENQDKQIQETLSNIQNIESNISNLSNAKNLNNQVNNEGDLMSIFTTALNPFAKTPSSNRFAPIYQAYSKETDPKKVEMEIEKMGYKKGMSTKGFNENTDRLIQENRNKLMQQYANLGYKILQDDETGAIRVVDNNGKIIKEF